MIPQRPHFLFGPATRPRHIICLALLALFGALAYSNTLTAPWYFDDYASIVNNLAIRDISGSIKGLLDARGVANFTFALNYLLSGIDTTSYHLTNILIHILTSGLVFLLMKRIWRQTLLLPFFGALIFLLHPLQTQAVTYLVQRMTSLAGLFFFLSIYLFCHAREQLSLGRPFFSARHIFSYLGAILCGVLAVSTKQNTAILPVALFLFEAFFSAAPKRRRLKLVAYLLPFTLAPLWCAMQQLVVPALSGTAMQTIASSQSLANSGPATPIHYLATEFSVVWIYLKLLFFPVGQALDYGYPIVKQLITLKTLLAFAGLLGLGGIAIGLRHKRPLISFGIAWFFLSLTVESTIIPLDPIFEHRLYIPMFGFAIVLLDLLGIFFQNKKLLIACGLLCVGLALLSWQRNALWNDPVAFWQDNLHKAPNSERVNLYLAKNYIAYNRPAEARALLENAIKINPQYTRLYSALSDYYVSQGDYPQAKALLEKGLLRDQLSVELLSSLGVFYDMTGETQKAIETLRKALLYRPDNPKTYLDLGVVYAGQQQWQTASELYKKAISLIYEYDMAHFNLGVAEYQQGHRTAALQEFKLAARFNPQNTEALYNWATVAYEIGNTMIAKEITLKLAGIDPKMAAKLSKEIAAAARK